MLYASKGNKEPRSWIENTAKPLEDHKEYSNTGIIKTLCESNKYYKNSVPFRVSEDDPASRYIFKIQRHSKL